MNLPLSVIGKRPPKNHDASQVLGIMSQPSDERPVFQPLHTSVIHRLDPKYIEYHNSLIQYIPSIESIPWNPALRNRPPLPGGTPPLDVAATKDYPLPHGSVRTFTPHGTIPEDGWPVLIWFHGGGWMLGNISSESSLCTNMCESK
jgi:acetyl esterase/lipase